jgi:hypothetical protein
MLVDAPTRREQALVNAILANARTHSAMARPVFDRDEAQRSFAAVLRDQNEQHRAADPCDRWRLRPPSRT